MADETTQTGEDTSFWDLDVFADSELPSTAFDEPLEWPETLDWGEFSAPGGDPGSPIDDLDSNPIFPPAPGPEVPAPEAGTPEAPAPAPDIQWRAGGDDGDATMPHITVLSGLGGGAAPVAKAAEPTTHERLPDSLWAGAAGTPGTGGGNGVAPVVTTTMAAPALYAEPDRRAGDWRRRFDIRHGNAAIIALISLVSLILLGMFMSVRARNQTPDTSLTRTTSDQIQVGPLNTVPLTTTVTTTASAINIADLVPPAEDATTPSAGAGGSGGSSPATAAAPARSTPAAGATATTQPAAQPTNTTAAPPTTAAPDTTTPSVTSPPASEVTTPSVPRRTTPTFPTTPPTVDSTPTIPSIPGFPTIPGFNNSNSN
jgi:hypothetical protein